MAEIAEVDEEFVDLLDMAYGPSDPSPAYTPEESNNDSHAAQAAGSDLADAGDKGLSAPDVTSEAPSPVSRPKKTTPPKTGPKKKTDEAEKAREKSPQRNFGRLQEHRQSPGQHHLGRQ